MSKRNETANEPCEGCDGSGIRAPATPSCRLPILESGWFVVERCDYCERYSDDLCAAESQFLESKWIRCASGGWHAIARSVHRFGQQFAVNERAGLTSTTA